MDESTLQGLASEAVSWFETFTRDASPDDVLYRTRDGAPEWVLDLVYAAHGADLLPDDWRYGAIHSALLALAEDDADPDDAHEWADAEVDVYTHALLAWLSSNLTRPGYVDDAVAELGGGVLGDGGIVGAIGLGQYAEACEVYSLVVEALRERAETVEDEREEVV